jgi:hypothetical protein
MMGLASFQLHPASKALLGISAMSLRMERRVGTIVSRKMILAAQSLRDGEKCTRAKLIHPIFCRCEPERH